MNMRVLEIGKERISCNIRRKNVQHIYMRLKPDLQLEIILPYDSNVEVEDILEKKRGWIETKVKELSKTRKLFDNNKILYKGRQLEIKVLPAKRPGKGVRLYNKVIMVYENPQRNRDKILTDFITKETLSYIQERAREFAKDLGVTYSNISTKDMKRWGQCSRMKNIFFNSRLIGLPERLIDYVIFHELLHLKHFNHSRQFKRALKRYFIDCKEIEIALKYYLPLTE